ncbi:MAG: GNAT family N-acetyltransferase [Actinomycetota bacterium]
MAVRRVTTDELTARDLAALRDLVFDAFADDPEAFTDEDWQHALGGVHFVFEEAGAPVAHGSVIERELHTGDHRLSTGYVEAVATRRDLQGRGHGSTVMREVGEYIDRTFPLGALDTGVQAFYERLGWLIWKGPTFVRTESGMVRTAEDDGGVMVRLTPSSPELDLSAPLSCEWRPGDVW